LHEEEAEFGGGFEDEFAVAVGVGGIVEGDELVGEGASLVGEIGEASAQGFGRGSAAPGAAGFVEDLGDGLENLWGVLRDEADGFALDEKAVFADGGFDGEVLAGREADELGEFEVDGAEAVEERDEVVGMAAADGEVGAAEGSPGWGDGAVELLLANAAEELGVGGGTASGDSAKGAALAEETAEVEGLEGIGEDLWFVHRDSGAPKRANFSPLRLIGLFIIKELVVWKRQKRAKNSPLLTIQPCQRVAPLISWYGWGGRNPGARRRVVGR
jgi:hypothetical protein